EARKHLVKAMKTAFPDISIPEVDAAHPLQEEIKKINARLDKQDEERTSRQHQRAAKQKHDELLAHGWTQKQIDDVVQFATDNGISHFDAAAALYREQNPPEPSTRIWDDPRSAAQQEEDADYINKLFKAGGNSDSIATAHAMRVTR